MSSSEAFRDTKMEVSCGQCIGCRLEKSRQWAVRIMHETQLHDISSFVTLTYNDAHLPENNTLIKKDLRLFHRRLRKTLPHKIRYFACGEYGEKTSRAHYHSIIFGYWPDDSRYLEQTEYGTLYTSEKLANIWGKGNVSIGTVQFESAAYVSNYVTKKITGKKADEHYKGRLPEFSAMSRRPGIGYDWYVQYKSETVRDNVIVMRGKEMQLPQYYKRKLREENSLEENWKHKWKFDKPIDLNERSFERLKVKEQCQQAKTDLYKKDKI